MGDFYKPFVRGEQSDGDAPGPGPETTDVGFFDLGNLPPLSRGRVIEQDLVAAFEFADNPTRLALFD